MDGDAPRTADEVRRFLDAWIVQRRLRLGRGRDGLVVGVTLFLGTTAVARQLLAAPAAGRPLERGMALAQRTRVAVRRLRR